MASKKPAAQAPARRPAKAAATRRPTAPAKTPLKVAASTAAPAEKAAEKKTPETAAAPTKMAALKSAKPSVKRQAVAAPAAAKPVRRQPVEARTPAATKPIEAKPTLVEPVAAEAAEVETFELVKVGSVAAKTEAAKPVSVEANVAKPVSVEADVAKPEPSLTVADLPEADEPKAAAPVVAAPEPKTVEPEPRPEATGESKPAAKVDQATSGSAAAFPGFPEFAALPGLDLDAFAASSAAVAAGLQAVGDELMNFSRSAAERQVEATMAVLSAGSVEQAVEVQTQYAMRSVDALFDQGTKLTGMAMDVASRAAAPFMRF